MTMKFKEITISGTPYERGCAYGRMCREEIAVSIKVYQLLFIPMVVVGATTSLDVVWDVADTFNGLMAIPNFIALFALSGTVAKLVKNYFAGKK